MKAQKNPGRWPGSTAWGGVGGSVTAQGSALLAVLLGLVADHTVLACAGPLMELLCTDSAQWGHSWGGCTMQAPVMSIFILVLRPGSSMRDHSWDHTQC